MLRRLIHWIKTGEPLPEVDSSEWSNEAKGDSLYSIQVKESLVHEQWEWRILKEGRVIPQRAGSPRTHGWGYNRGRAKAEAKKSIKQLELRERQELIDWEDA